MTNHPLRYEICLTINGNEIKTVLIGRHYLKKHRSYMNDELILSLVRVLDGGHFPVDSTTDGVEYFIADIEWGDPVKTYRLIWIFEGKEILGIVNAYRRTSKKK